MKNWEKVFKESWFYMGMKAKFERKVLKNGMTVVFEKRDNEVVSIAFAVRYGSANEGMDEKGIAHFIEHLMYKGTAKRTSKNISEEIEKKGGVLNGFTSEQITAYWCKLPSEYLMVGLNVLSDMILNSKYDPAELDKEKHVIFEEMKMWKDSPQLRVIDKTREGLFTGSLGEGGIGTEDSLNKMGREEIVKKVSEVYGTNQMILCVVGDAEFSDVCEFAEKTFPKNDVSIENIKFSKQITKKVEKRKGVDQANFTFSYHIPSLQEDGYYVALLLNGILSGGMSSRLFQEIREKRNLAYSVKGSVNSDKEYGFSSIFVGAKQENLKKVEELIVEEFEKIKDLDEKELEEVKGELIGNRKISSEDSQEQMMELLGG